MKTFKTWFMKAVGASICIYLGVTSVICGKEQAQETDRKTRECEDRCQPYRALYGGLAQPRCVCDTTRTVHNLEEEPDARPE